MYQHLRVAIEQAQERRLYDQQLRNFRRRRRNTIELVQQRLLMIP